MPIKQNRCVNHVSVQNALVSMISKRRKQFLLFHLLSKIAVGALFLPFVLCGAPRAYSSTCVPSSLVILKLAVEVTLALGAVG